MAKSTLVLENLAREYKKNNQPLIFDFKSASINLLGEKNKHNQTTHYIHYYPGRIFPYIPFYLLSLKELMHFDGYLLDPFAGSGTILLEAITNSVLKRNALGVEINPLARLISKVKTTSLNVGKITQYMNKIIYLYQNTMNAENHIPEFKNREIWFSNNAVKKLGRLRYAIHRLDADMDYRDFFWVCFSSIIRKIAKADPYIPPPVILKLEKYKNNPRKYQRLKEHLKNAENPNVLKLFEQAVDSNKHKINLLNNSKEVSKGKVRARVIWDDTREIKKGNLFECGRIDKNSATNLASGSIDIIFTSPPYLTAQKYIRTSRLELLWLGYTEKEINDLEKMSIGTEKVQKSYKITPLGIRSIDSLVNYALSISFERASVVYKYFRDMVESLKEMHRLLKKKGYLILVVGDNKVLGKRVETYRLLADIASRIGFNEIITLKDSIKSRSMMTKRNDTGGIIKNEYITLFKKEV